MMEDYLVGIGKKIKEIRKGGNKTISEIALKAAVTGGLISRVENGRTIPSLPVLLKIIGALNVEVAEFFKGMAQASGAKYIISRKQDQGLIEKEDQAEGFEYRAIFGKQLSSLGFEALILKISPNSKREKVCTDAFEFKYVLSGECFYRIDDEEVLLQEGDSIFFDGRIPHVPVNKGHLPTTLLVLYFFI